ncbi:MAG: hypothetical protein HYV09_08105 [Deltaproteobacteria bacterium]|nr:hypothetical protein [Deltaproteobacteria bacterium]
MTRTLAPLAVLAFVAGCAGSTTSAPTLTAPTMTALPAIAHAALAGSRPPPAAKTEVKTPGITERQPGDFVVFRFSGTFHKGPITLTERVIAREGSVLVVDFTLAETVATAKGPITREQTLRAKIDTKIGGRGQVFGVSKIEGAAATPATVADWEAMMAKTVVSADANEETFGTEEVTVKVGAKDLAADRTVYKVLIGDKSATMTITQSDAFAWGDLGGEIVTEDGSVLYRAEIVDAGSTPIGHVAADDD